MPPVLLIVKFTRNNIFLNVIRNGKTLHTRSLGLLGTKNAEKRTSLAIEKTFAETMIFIVKKGYKLLAIHFNGSYKDARTQVLEEARQVNLVITEVRDITSVPFNGSQLKKQRRRKHRG
jgi:ribosomal protein S11